MISELIFDNIWLIYRSKKSKQARIGIYSFFFAKIGVKYFQIQPWDHFWNPLIKVNILDPKYESGMKTYFWGGFHSILKLLSCAQTKKVIVWGKLSYVIARLQFHGISSENMKKLTLMQDTP